MSSRFVKNSGILLSGSAIAQGVAFAAYLLLSRLFTPDDFGLYNVFYSYIEVLIILSTCKYEMAIVKANTDAEAHVLTRFSLRLNTTVSATLLVVAALLALLCPSAAPMPPALLLLIPFMVFFCGTTRVYTFVFNRYKHFRQIAFSEVVTSLSGVTAKIAFGLLATACQLLHYIGLPAGTVLGKIAGNIYYRTLAAKVLPKQPRRKTDKVSLHQILAKHKAFPLYSMPREFVSSLSANLPFMWLGVHFDDALLGLFSLAITFTMRPVNILANAFEKVFYPTTNEKICQRQPIGRNVLRFLFAICAIALPVLLAAFFFAEPIFTFLFGNKWIGTGYFVRCLIPWIAVLLLTNSLAFIPNVFTTQRGDFVFQVVLLILRSAALAVGVGQHNFRLAILLFCAVSAAVQLCQLIWYLLQVRRHDRSVNNKQL